MIDWCDSNKRAIRLGMTVHLATKAMEVESAQARRSKDFGFAHLDGPDEGIGVLPQVGSGRARQQRMAQCMEGQIRLGAQPTPRTLERLRIGFLLRQRSARRTPTIVEPAR